MDLDNRITYDWDARNKVPCGINEPKVWGNLNTMFRYKNLTLNAVFSYRCGGQVYNSTLVDKVENADIQYNVDKRIYTDRWFEAGQAAKFKRITDPNYFTRPTSRFVQDLSELQMTSLNISYDFRHHKFIANSGLEQLKLMARLFSSFLTAAIDIPRAAEMELEACPQAKVSYSLSSGEGNGRMPPSLRLVENCSRRPVRILCP